MILNLVKLLFFIITFLFYFFGLCRGLPFSLSHCIGNLASYILLSVHLDIKMDVDHTRKIGKK
jgi:hypothetical protein